MVIDRLNTTKEKAEKTLNELRANGNPLDYDTIAALEGKAFSFSFQLLVHFAIPAPSEGKSLA